jgi:hypothetical protein
VDDQLDLVAALGQPVEQVVRGATKSAIADLAIFFHLFCAASPSQSQTTTSRLSSSHSLATMLEPMNPAPPVTRMTRLDMVRRYGTRGRGGKALGKALE